VAIPPSQPGFDHHFAREIYSSVSGISIVVPSAVAFPACIVP
jgi:hypothetical protein